MTNIYVLGYKATVTYEGEARPSSDVPKPIYQAQASSYQPRIDKAVVTEAPSAQKKQDNIEVYYKPVENAPEPKVYYKPLPTKKSGNVYYKPVDA